MAKNTNVFKRFAISGMLASLLATGFPKIQANDVQANDAKQTASTNRSVTNSIAMKFVEIPAGKFQMGSPESEIGSRIDERPVHEVEISHPFLLEAVSKPTKR